MKLICYPTSGKEIQIRLAPATRQWMDQTPVKFANRCLPLSIANASGWEILNPVAFSAIWDGSKSSDAICITCKDAEPIALSHFGSGILTFHINGLFETPPGVALWAGGSPNRCKDAIQPLVGIIETDWCPYTFTMNWMFTRPNQRIFFEKDEPFCFFYPFNMELLEAVEPEFRSFEDNPVLADNYAQWSASRKNFNADLKQPDSTAQQQKWQKTYHRGIRLDDTKTETIHRTRLRLKKFENIKKHPTE